MKISVLAGIVLVVAVLALSLGLLADYEIIPKPLTPEERARQQAEALKDQPELFPDIETTTTLEAEEKSVDFGLQEEGVEVTHEFKFKNLGKNTLKISGIRPSCHCIFVKEEGVEVAPGETGVITVGMKTKDLLGPQEKFVLLRTNDAEHRELSIRVTAVVMKGLEQSPETPIIFSRLLATDTAKGETKIYAKHERPFEIKAVRFLRPEIAQFFDVTYRPLEPAELPPDGKHGWAVTVNVKPGLPTGGFTQLVEVETTLEKSPTTVIQVEGNVVNDISIVAIGVDFNSKHSVLSLGTVKQDRGAKAKLKMLVAGEFRDKIELGTPVCEPDFLKVTYGEHKSINNGSATEVPIEIEIPAGTPIMSLLGKGEDGVGRVTIPTNHSSMKEVRILLHFSIEK